MIGGPNSLKLLLLKLASIRRTSVLINIKDPVAARILPSTPSKDLGRRQMTRLNFDHLKDRKPALIKDLGRKRGSLYWLRGWEVFEQIKRPFAEEPRVLFLVAKPERPQDLG